jgi:hypothetical protein
MVGPLDTIAPCSWTPEESQVKSCEHQHNADIHCQPFPESVSEEHEIYTDYDGCHRHHVKHDRYLSAHFSSIQLPAGLPATREPSQAINTLPGLQVCAGFFLMQALMVAAVSAWRSPKLTFECAIEGSFRLVSDIGGNVRDPARCLLEPLGGQLKPPSRQICHRWLGEVSGKALHESGPRDAHLIRKSRYRPRMGNAAMEQS